MRAFADATAAATPRARASSPPRSSRAARLIAPCRAMAIRRSSVAGSGG